MNFSETEFKKQIREHKSTEFLDELLLFLLSVKAPGWMLTALSRELDDRMQDQLPF